MPGKFSQWGPHLAACFEQGGSGAGWQGAKYWFSERKTLPVKNKEQLMSGLGGGVVIV